MKYSFCLIFLNILSVFTLSGQALSNQGALISVKDAAFVSVHGIALNDKDGLFHNSESIFLYGDWLNFANNEAFSSIDEGIVLLNGSDQRIGGSSETRFYDLRLQNAGIKFADIDVYVDGFLRLNDRAFLTDTNIVFVFNDSVHAVEHNQQAGFWGFVSSEGEGGLYRAMASNDEYLFPLGSYQGGYHFRPVIMQAPSSDSNAYCLRLAYQDASLDGLDRNQKALEICLVNPNFYHKITRYAGVDSMRLSMLYDAALDGDFNAIGHWDINNFWEVNTLGSNTTASLYNMDRLDGVQWIGNFNPNPFALIQRSPNAILNAEDSIICSDGVMTFSASSDDQDFDFYDFYYDGQLMQSGTAMQWVLNQPDSGLHQVWVVGQLADCGDASDSFQLNVLPAVVATISPDTLIVAGTAAQLYASGGDFYDWIPAMDLSCSICPQTEAFPDSSTIYTVEVENMEGCFDTLSVFVEVRERVDDILFIPNVLTPNGDGFNDSWEIRNISLFPKNSVRILNRWGDQVYSTNNYTNNWDGSYGNGLLPAGTYYYILDLGGNWGVFKGDVTILRE